MDRIKQLMDAAGALNQAAVDFAKRKSKKPLKDGSALGLESAALNYAKAVEAVTAKTEPAKALCFGDND